MTNQKRILSVQDISCFGKCSNTVAMPILSAAGMEAVMLPTALLSTHTGGFTGFTFLDLTEEMERILSHFETVPVLFDMLYTGYFGSAEQLSIVKRHKSALLKEQALFVVDPVLGDNGKLYAIYDEAYVAAMRAFCQGADVITPNMTEACLLAGLPFCGNQYAPDAIAELLHRLHEIGAKQVLLTGVRFGDTEIGVVGSTQDGATPFLVKSRYLDVHLHGTGDVLTSSLCAYLAKGLPFPEAAKGAIHFISACIDHTEKALPEHWYGLLFEPCLPMLADFKSAQA